MVSVFDFIAVYSIGLVVFGTVGNMIAFFVCCQLKENTTFVFLAMICISDTAAIYFWNLQVFLGRFFGLDLQMESIVSCRIGSYIQFTFLQISAWLLVLMSLDRLLTLMTLKWKSNFKAKHAALVSGACFVIFLAGNLNVAINYGEVLIKNGTETVICHSIGDAKTAWISTYDIVQSCMYSYVPFAILTATNMVLISEFKNRQVQAIESAQTRRKRRSMNRTVILVTFFFILLTLPGAIVTNMYTYLVTQPFGQLIIQLFGRISSSYHACGLVVIYFTNQRFSQKLRFIVSSKPSFSAPSTQKD